MRIFKTRAFKRWADSEKCTDAALLDAAIEISLGLVDANLGGSVYKKRVIGQNKGKRGGNRTLIAFRFKDKAFFIYGFAKSKQANIKDDELKALKILAKNLFSYSNKTLASMIEQGVLTEVQTNG